MRRTNHPDVWWAIHNLIAHPVSEVLHWVSMDGLGNAFHDATIPEHAEGQGRG